MSNNFNWECPYCKKSQVGGYSNSETNSLFFKKSRESCYGSVGLQASYAVCTNDNCKKISLSTKLLSYDNDYERYDGEALESWKLLPDSQAKPQPICVPKPLAGDYYEACKIRDLSPKASATLARRCLQGMIRDFCGVSKGRLIDEINTLRKLADEAALPSGVSEDTIDAMDHVRGIGNIGAHFEKDINIIVEVDPNEAQTLIELIEMLFEEWYVARDIRKNRLARIEKLGQGKTKERQAAQAATAEQSNSDNLEKTQTS